MCGAGAAGLTRCGSLLQPARPAARGAGAPHTQATGSEIKAREETPLLHTRLQYILSTLLAGRPNDAFPFRIAKRIILSVLGVMFMCLWECDPYSVCYRHEPDAFLSFRCMRDTLLSLFLSFPPSSFLPFFFPPLTF